MRVQCKLSPPQESSRRHPWKFAFSPIRMLVDGFDSPLSACAEARERQRLVTPSIPPSSNRFRASKSRPDRVDSPPSKTGEPGEVLPLPALTPPPRDVPVLGPVSGVENR
jgi:hypothetical protein